MSECMYRAFTPRSLFRVFVEVGNSAGALLFILAFILIGWFVLVAATIWYIWRVAKGWLKLNDGEALPDPEAWI